MRVVRPPDETLGPDELARVLDSLTGLVLTHEALGAVIGAAALFAAMTVLVSYRKYARG